jgi:hypothetical protein
LSLSPRSGWLKAPPRARLPPSDLSTAPSPSRCHPPNQSDPPLEGRRERFAPGREARARPTLCGEHGVMAIERAPPMVRQAEFGRRELVRLARWPQRGARNLQVPPSGYNEHRPHESLAGKTPNEVYRGVKAANEAPRFEPRARWPSSAPCARPQAAPRLGPAPKRLELHVRFLDDDRTLPVVELKQAA